MAHATDSRQRSGSGGDQRLARAILEPTSGAAIALTSTSIQPGGAIPPVHSDYDQKVSPQLSWSNLPQGTASVVLMMEDPDAPEPKPYVHWLMYNLPPGASRVPEAQSSLPRLPELGGALQGRSSRGTVGYFGPRPPKPDPAHHYHFQVFALDTMLTLPAGADRSSLLDAMRGHVLAAGELVGTFKAPA